jgi:acetate kinase
MNATPPLILTLNAGSSSLKYKVFHGEVALLAGHVAGIGLGGTSTVTKAGISRTEHHTASTHEEAVTLALAAIAKATSHDHIAVVAHRVVHGGERFAQHCVITPSVEQGIAELATLAPLHNPANLAGIRAAQRALPAATHVACFDTAFHHTIPRFAFLYGLPYKLYTHYGIRKYGFHGLSHEYCAQRVYELSGTTQKLVSCHLGAGSSLTAIDNGRSLDTTMGFTPLDGLLMATRAGELDPDIPLYLQKREGLTPDQVLELLNTESGLKGLTGHADLREVKTAADAGDERAQTAIEMLCYRIALGIGAYAITLGGVQVITFTGGIGENAPWLRARVCQMLAPLGVALDKQANERGAGKIHAPSSIVAVFVIPADEELHMARIVLGKRYQ